MKHFIGSILLLIFIYFAFAFVQAKLNPFNWSQDTRGLSIGLYVLSLLIVNMFLLMHTDLTRKN